MTALVIGEALVDVVRRPGSAESESRHPGGSPANVAFGLGRLGRQVSLLTRLGDDDDGMAIRTHLKSAAVDVRNGGRPLDRTSTAVATIDADGGATYSFDLAWDLDATTIPEDPLVVHTGSLATTVLPGADAVEQLMHQVRSHSTISYDPNIRPMLVGPVKETRERVQRLVAASDVVKASDEDVEWLAPGLPPREMAQRWLDLGPALVVITRGRGGVVAVTRSGAIDLPAPPVIVADTIGAGDSFMAALLDGLWTEGLLGAAVREQLSAIDPDRVRQVLEYSARAAAITVSRIGADPPTRAELAPS